MNVFEQMKNEAAARKREEEDKKNHNENREKMAFIQNGKYQVGLLFDSNKDSLPYRKIKVHNHNGINILEQEGCKICEEKRKEKYNEEINGYKWKSYYKPGTRISRGDNFGWKYMGISKAIIFDAKSKNASKLAELGLIGVPLVIIFEKAVLEAMEKFILENSSEDLQTVFDNNGKKAYFFEIEVIPGQKGIARTARVDLVREGLKGYKHTLFPEWSFEKPLSECFVSENVNPSEESVMSFITMMQAAFEEWVEHMSLKGEKAVPAEEIPDNLKQGCTTNGNFDEEDGRCAVVCKKFEECKAEHKKETKGLVIVDAEIVVETTDDEEIPF